jgi:hypothetical protein
MDQRAEIQASIVVLAHRRRAYCYFCQLWPLFRRA